jgi:uncharacterized RDD family membrane protein YckC
MAFTATPDPVPDAIPGAGSAGAAAFSGAGSSAAAASPDWLPHFSHPRPGAPVTALTSYPRASFLDRLAAGVVDICLILIANGLLMPRLFARNDGFVFLLAFAYFVAFWTWKQTTVGGIVCNLRLTRTDGVQLGPAEAVVRGLASIFSFFALGLGFLWILRDPERQAWHDKVAGTYVVKVPANMPLSLVRNSPAGISAELMESRPDQMENFKNVDPKWVDVAFDPGDGSDADVNGRRKSVGRDHLVDRAPDEPAPLYDLWKPKDRRRHRYPPGDGRV